MKTRALFLKLLHSISNFLILHIELQLFITLISLPILIAWGMPLSLASFIGNLVFSPLMTAFLGVSVLVFITTLLHIPNALLIFVLDKITEITNLLLSYGSSQFLYAFKKPHWILGLGIMLLTIFVVVLHKHTSSMRRIGALLGIACSIFICFKISDFTFSSIPQTPHIIPGTKNKLSLSYTDNSWQLQDSGCFNTKQTPEHFIVYELKPYIHQQFGNIEVKGLVLERPGIRSFKAAQQVISQFPIKHIAIKKPVDQLSKYAWRTFYDLKRSFNNNSIQFI